KGLAHVSNAKLLRLHALFTEVKEKFGTREKLIEAILELQKRTKDVGLRQKLSEWPVPRLYDAYKSTAKRIGVAAKASAPRPKAEAKAKARPDAPAGKSTKAAKSSKAGTRAAKKSVRPAAKKAAKKGSRK